VRLRGKFPLFLVLLSIFRFSLPLSHKFNILSSELHDNYPDTGGQLIYKATQGIPRLVNHICTQALFDADRRGSAVIEDSHIGRILADLERQRGLTA
jgi:hypothetical protein